MHHVLARMTKNPLFESVLITVYQNNPGYNFELILDIQAFFSLDAVPDFVAVPIKP